MQKHINIKFPQYDAKFYLNRSSLYIHMGLGKSLFSFEDFKKLLAEVDCFLNEHLPNKFNSIYPRKLIHWTKWKHDYILSQKN